MKLISMKLFSTFIVLLITFRLSAQIDSLKRYINNRNVQFRVWFISPQIDDTIVVVEPKFVVHVTMDDNVKSLVKYLKRDDWRLLLRDTTMDWATNLLLYELYKKDGHRFKGILNRDEWISVSAKEDEEFWMSKLSEE